MKSKSVEVKPATTELDPARFCLVLFNTLTCISAGLGSGLGWSGSEGHMTSTNAFAMLCPAVLSQVCRY